MESLVAGMTIDEIKAVLGKPRQIGSCLQDTYLNYGRIWVVCRNGIATGYVPVELFQSPCAHSVLRDEKPFRK